MSPHSWQMDCRLHVPWVQAERLPVPAGSLELASPKSHCPWVVAGAKTPLLAEGFKQIWSLLLGPHTTGGLQPCFNLVLLLCGGDTWDKVPGETQVGQDSKGISQPCAGQGAALPGAVLPTQGGTGGSLAECAGAKRALGAGNPLPSLLLLLQCCCRLLMRSVLPFISLITENHMLPVR